MPTAEAIKKAKIKYEQNLKKLNAMIDKQIYNEMLQYCKEKSTTQRAFLEAAITKYIDSN